MGGGDLNMKKSWHPLLIKNQERVWLEERKALAEKRKLDQLRKEKEEERHMQELQRLQEEQTGKKRSEKLEWMYATPASGGSTNPNDLEDYLLGKKRVDKVLTGDDNAKLGASHRSFIAVQSANTARDMAAKIREDPLLAIKQQEQAAYQALVSNPLRLKAMKEKVGIKEKDSKKEKKHKHKHRHHHRHQDSDEDMDHRRDRDSRRFSRSPRERDHPPPDRRRRLSYSRSRSRSPSPRRYRSPHNIRARARPRSISPPNGYENRESRRSYDDRRDRDRHPRRSRSRTPPRQDYRDGPLGSGSSDDRARRRNSRSCSPPPRRERMSPPKRMTNGVFRPNGQSEPAASKPPSNDDAAERAARLAAMSKDANALEAARATRLAALAAAEEAERKAEDAKRKETFSKNGTGQGRFMRDQSKLAYGGSIGLEERLRRGRGGLVRDID